MSRDSEPIPIFIRLKACFSAPAQYMEGPGQGVVSADFLLHFPAFGASAFGAGFAFISISRSSSHVRYFVRCWSLRP
jgi:hypothetical protein